MFENKTKIIITTNKNLDEIDSAIIRPGRCFDILKFKPLSYNQAKYIWEKEFLLKEFEKYFPKDSFVSQAELMLKFKDFRHNSIDRKYLKDKTMSLKKFSII